MSRPNSTPTLHLLGTCGSSISLQRGQTSLCLINQNSTLLFDFGHLITSTQGKGKFELYLKNVVELLSRCKTGRFIATHLSLRHLEDKKISTEEREENFTKIIQEVLSQARDRGFVGSLELGVDLMQVFP